ncbi:MAG: arginine--tRNA ligase, partial [Oscillospiraceae bacterium]|nr:arginine--tRNA ligase [Oscillospiraceae bacterium]
MNCIEQAKQALDALLHQAYDSAVAAGEFGGEGELRGSVEQPKDSANGDFAANHAMASAKALRMPPRKIAETLVAHLNLAESWFSSAEVAGPGFLNFRLSPKWYADVLQSIEAEGADYGRVDDGHGEKVMVEFVSANPTGPMTIGNARGGVLGDAMAAVLDRAGYDVWREFYVNDAGNQVDLFGRSIEARYLQLIQGEDAVEFPDNGYHGDDIKALAKLIYERDGEKYLTVDSEARRAEFVAFGLPYNIERMQRDLERYRIHFDQWFLESSLHNSGYVAETVKLLEDAGLTYEKDGALWLKNTDLGADKDEVLRRSNGFYTYYAVDVAYHRNKFIERGFDRVIDVWGADHHGHAVRFAATMKAPALGLEHRKLDFLIMQMVRLVRGDEVVKVSKRTGKALTLADLMDEIGVDACRFFFNAKPDTHLEFD